MPVILQDGACSQAKTCYRHQEKSSSDLPNLRNILTRTGLCRRSLFRPAVLEVIDPNQYGCIPASSTLHAPTYMLHVPGCKPPTGLGLL